MKLLTRRSSVALPGLVGTARVGPRLIDLLPRLTPGDIAVVDEVDLGREAAQALLDARVAGVVNAQPMISGRYPNLGPLLLVEAGVAVVDLVGAGAMGSVRDGRRLRLHEGDLLDPQELVASGREVDEDGVRAEMETARRGMLAQLDGFTRDSADFLRREQDLLLHGLGLPELSTSLRDRPAVVVGPAATDEDLAALKHFLRDRRPAVIAVGQAADRLRDHGVSADVVVVCEDDSPSLAALTSARDVVVCAPTGARRSDALEHRRVRTRAMETAASGEDAALLIADAGAATVLVGVGLHVGLELFLDRDQAGPASTYLTRLKVGHRLVDAGAVGSLYSGAVRPRHVYLALVVGLLALAAAIAVTPVGQDWLHDLPGWWSQTVDHLRDRAHGIVGTGS